MSQETKRCPYCHEEIMAAARKCKHCGEWMGNPPTSSTGDYSDPETLIRHALEPQYTIEKEIGRGGMAIVYKAVQQSLQRPVALKVLPQGLTHDRKLLERFHREARSAALLSHPHIVTIFDEGEMNGVHYMAMEYLDGKDLHYLVQRNGRYGAQEAINIIAPIAEALAYAHERNTVHRDVKSSNVMLTNQGRPVLMDFGIAYASSEARLTQTGTVLGTPEYMSPEQARGNEVDARSDIYSLGVVLYEALTAKLPHTGGHPMSVVYKVLHEDYTSPRQINSDVPEWLEKVIAKCLVKSADDRYQTGKELAEALRHQDPGTNVPSIGRSTTTISVGDSGPSQPSVEPAKTQVFRPGADADVAEPVAAEPVTAAPRTKPSTASPHRQQLHIVRTVEGSADWVNAVAFSVDAQYALTGGNDNTVKLWEVVSGDVQQTFEGLSNQPIAVTLSPNGQYVCIGTSDGVVQLFSVADGSLQRTITSNSKAVLCTAFSADGAHVAAGDGPSGAITLWETETGRKVRTFDDYPEAIFSIAFSPDNHYVLTGSGQSGTATLWETATGRRIRTFEDKNGENSATYTFSVAFSPDSKYAISGSDDMTARIWDVETGELVRAHDNHSALVIGVAFSPDGQYVLTGTSDMRVQLWKMANGDLGYVFEGQTDGVNAIAFSPDGRYVLSGSKESNIRLWTP